MLGLLGGEGESAAEGFFEFKMRKMQERKMREQQQELQQHHNQSEQDRQREEDENDGMLACHLNHMINCLCIASGCILLTKIITNLTCSSGMGRVRGRAACPRPHQASRQP